MANRSAERNKLLQLVRKHYLEPPSKKPYKLKEDLEVDLTYREYKFTVLNWIYSDIVVKLLFQNKTFGFFVEAGALDGEYMSNTLRLEKELNWTGLLVEVDSKKYLQMRKKNRKAWLSPACLATQPYPHKTLLSKFTGKREGKGLLMMVPQELSRYCVGRGWSWW